MVHPIFRQSLWWKFKRCTCMKLGTVYGIRYSQIPLRRMKWDPCFGGYFIRYQNRNAHTLLTQQTDSRTLSYRRSQNCIKIIKHRVLFFKGKKWKPRKYSLVEKWHWPMHPIEYYGTIKKTKVDPYVLSFSEREQAYTVRGKQKQGVEHYVYYRV